MLTRLAELEQKVAKMDESIQRMTRWVSQFQPKYYKRIFADGKFKNIPMTKEELLKELI